MAEKRKANQEASHHSKAKRFKEVPTSKVFGKSKPAAAKSAKQHGAGSRAVKKKTVIRAKWKKKQKYIFKTGKTAVTSSEKYRKIPEDDDRMKSFKQNSQSNVDGSAPKKKKRKLKKKKARQVTNKDAGTSNASSKADETDSKQSEGTATITSNEDGSAQKKKKRKQKRKKAKQVINKAAADTPNTSSRAEETDSKQSETATGTSKSWKKIKRKGSKSDGKNDLNKKQEEDSDLVLPRKPDEVSANWKAMMSKIQKEDSKKVSKKKQEAQRKGKGDFKGKSKTKSPDIWFDDVDPELLKANDASVSFTKTADDQSEPNSKFVVEGKEDGPTKCVALDCEMVGAGRDGKDNLLARVSIVNQYGYCLYDKFVKPREDVTDYRTWVSGVRAKDLETGEDFLTVQKQVADLLKGRVLVGHALQNDMKVLFLDHPKKMVRDTFRYEEFRKMFRSRRPGLKGLVEKILHVQFQQGEHSSVEDAQAVMKLYMLHRKNWEASLKTKPGTKTKKKKTSR